MDDENATQSCITNVSFPTGIDSLRSMLKKNACFGPGMTDIETLLRFTPDCGLAWTAPKWMTHGDILFFYHAASAKARIRSLQRQLTATFPPETRLIAVLDRAAQFAQRYSGTIFAYSRINGSPARALTRDTDAHFRSRLFGDLENVHLFDSPIPSGQFREFVTISRQTALTPLFGSSFDGLKNLISKSNVLPPSLAVAWSGGAGFRNIDKSNWRSIACKPIARFIIEDQLRRYLIDFLLNELRDDKAPLLEECRCYRTKQDSTKGVADYFVKIHGTWIPVEVKLNILAEKKLSTQLKQYIDIHEFEPTRGRTRGRRFVTNSLPICLVIDQTGLFLTANGEFIECDPYHPLFTRIELGTVSVEQIRKRLEPYLKV